MSDNLGFPNGRYTPFGYLDNPHHSAVLNRSGVVRSVPPLGMGFWVRDLPWPYGNGFGHRRTPNYLSFLHLSMKIDEVLLHSEEDFARNKIELVSRYHTKLVLSLDFECRDVVVRARYFLDGERAVVGIIDVSNTSESTSDVALVATNIYGFPGEAYWGCDGLVADYRPGADAGVSKIWAYGDVMAVGANRKSTTHGVHVSEEQWRLALEQSEHAGDEHAETRFSDGGDHLYNSLEYHLSIPAGEADRIIVALTRGKNEQWVTEGLAEVLQSAPQILDEKLEEDARFYAGAPVLSGDWPEHWKHGWVYDLETLRMNIRPPVGIYTHPWDGMQVHTPRVVLGEASLDSFCLSYADPALARAVLLGTFADAPMPNVPCSREDGSMNMISANGKECGTAPIWGLPFHVLKSIYLREPDDQWIKTLYPHLKAFLEWWLEHRTDEDGWFHASCSWESGQDGSKRFLVDSHDPGAAAEFVRTVDIEAAMANAMKNMAFFAGIAGQDEDVAYWRDQADERIKHARSMYVDGWYRDIDARNDQPIFLKNIEAFGTIQENYYDIMMLTPVALGIATPEQLEGINPKFDHFQDHRKFWLEWPSFWQIFSEAAWIAGRRMLLSELITEVGERTYSRIDRRERLPVRNFDTGLPPQYNYRIPGVSMEFWPIDEDNPGGCENYGWGATFPALVIRNIIGFREVDRVDRDQFLLAPALPSSDFAPGKRYGMRNLRFRQCHFDVNYTVLEDDQLDILLTCHLESPAPIDIADEKGQSVACFDGSGNRCQLRFPGGNGSVYTVTVGE